MEGGRSRIVQLAAVIDRRTNEIDQYFSANSLPSPSFSVDAAPTLPLPQSLLKSRDEILEACTELQALAEGPVVHLTRLTSPTINILMSLQAILRFNIAGNLDIEEEATYEELAKRCNIDVQDARRLLRLAISNHIFLEPRKGIISHSAISKVLVQLPLVSQWVGIVCDEMWPSGCRTVDAMEKWPSSQEPTETGFSLVNGKSFFEVLQSDPGRGQRFVDGMKFLQSAPQFDIQHLLRDLEWTAETCPDLMVDIGGSHGSIDIQLLRKFPGLRCEVQDLAETVDSATIPDDLKPRLEFRAHNFFTEQPTRHADVYFLRSILHDWSDKYAIQILKNLVPALKRGSKVIINEVCLPEPNVLPFYHDQLLRGYDLAMKQNFNSKERDESEWKDLLLAADTRLSSDEQGDEQAVVSLQAISPITNINCEHNMTATPYLTIRISEHTELIMEASQGKERDEPLKESEIGVTNTTPVETTIANKPRNMGGLSWFFVVLSLISSMFLFALDNTIVANIQPSIIDSFQNVDKLPWVSVSYPLGVIALNLLLSNLFMLFDNKLLFIAGVVFFEIGSAVCGAAPNMTALIVGRVVCGIGGVGIYVGAMNLLSVLTTETERPMYLSFVGLTWGVGTVLGPIIGGAFADSAATWRWSFYLNLFVGAAAAPIYIFLLPSHNPGIGSSIVSRLQTLDWVGAILNCGALVSLVMGISFGGGVYSWNSGQIIGLLVTSGILWVFFIVQQTFAILTTKEHRLFPVKILKMTEMSILFAQIASAATVVYIPLYFVPLYFQFVKNDSPFDAAIRLLPLVFAQVVGVILSGALMNKVGYYLPWYVAGGIFSLVGGSLLYRVNIDTNSSAIYGYSVLVGLGSGLYVQASYPVAQLKVAASEIPRVVAFIGYGHIVGITLGLTISGSVFLNEATDKISEILPLLPRKVVQKGVTGAGGEFFETISPSQREEVLKAIVQSISNVYVMVIAAGAVTITLCFFMKREKLPTQKTSSVSTETITESVVGDGTS
ncbi:hypothetical protein HYFRA_00006117 [Hymenoscyphus fraxineus]|uniref:Major facilitator superfamily (MFS) profile domain-containing protein n=1 Tax=Hymenoscyphus fraxineus TaxID=746836 RepID=A0A9N9PZY5_9HELO|nr:hypothetical protein HYFRA_00006117 [Hymenoscyphus fraxineus]